MPELVLRLLSECLVGQLRLAQLLLKALDLIVKGFDLALCTLLRVLLHLLYLLFQTIELLLVRAFGGLDLFQMLRLELLHLLMVVPL